MRYLRINGKHMLNDYGGYLKKDISLDPPPIKERYVDLPANHGTLDLAESLTGEPQFNDRDVKFTLYFYENPVQFMATVETIINDLHGKRCTLIFDHAPLWQLEGRCSITHKHFGAYGEVYFEVPCKPFFYATTEKIFGTGNGSITLVNLGSQSVLPMVITTGTTTMSYPNQNGGTTTRTLSAGQWKFSDLKLKPNTPLVVTVTAGSASFRGREVRLSV